MKFISKTVTKDQQNMRLDRYVREEFELPQGLVQKSLRKNLIKHNTKKAKAESLVQEGDEIAVLENLQAEAKEKSIKIISPKIVEKIKDVVIYEDDDILAINKPSGLAVQGGSGITVSLDDIMDYFKNEGEKPRLVHRLDKDTSGILLLAKTRQAAIKLTDDFSEGRVQKTYYALSDVLPEKLQGTIREPIKAEDRWLEAQTEYFVAESRHDVGYLETVALFELTPLTGRKHQIRIHMKFLGCPILGDKKYGGSYWESSSILYLHAGKLIFTNMKGQKIILKAKLPVEFEKMMGD